MEEVKQVSKALRGSGKFGSDGFILGESQKYPGILENGQYSIRSKFRSGNWNPLIELG